MSTKTDEDEVFTDENFIKTWQSFYIREKLSEDPRSKAEAMRGNLTQLKYAIDSGKLCALSGLTEYLQATQRYASVMDSTEAEGGVNNYADTVLKGLAGRANHSKEWSSSLTADSIKSLPCVQKMIRENKKFQEKLVPPEKENAKLPLQSPHLEEELKKKLAARREAREKKTKESLESKTVLGQSNNTNGNTFNIFQGQSKPSNNDTYPPNKFRHISNDMQSGNTFQTNSSSHSFIKQTRGHNLFQQNQPSSSNFSNNQFGASNSSREQFSRDDNYNSHRQPALRRNEPQKRKQQEDEGADDNEDTSSGMFKTAREQLVIDQSKMFGRNRGGRGGGSGGGGQPNYGTQKKSLGTRRGLNSKFVPPILNKDEEEDPYAGCNNIVRSALQGSKNGDGEEEIDERLKNIDPKMIEVIMNEIMDHGAPIKWDDIAGLEFAKKTIKEIVVWPMLRPDIFTGLRGPPKGLLLFGPPGTGKTLIGKCIASQSKSTFFSISASSLTSKWIGEGEKMVRALFAVARVHQPAVIFIDEIDSLLSQRSTDEHEASRRIKTEFLVQLDGATTGEADRILVVGATNRPQEIDEAARRRFVKRLYIPLPEAIARQQLVTHLMQTQPNSLSEEDIEKLVDKTQGYSGADMANLCREAALGPIRSVAFEEIEHISADQVRPIMYMDFESALKQVRASVSQDDLDLYIDWNKQYGSWDL